MQTVWLLRTAMFADGFSSTPPICRFAIGDGRVEPGVAMAIW